MIINRLEDVQDQKMTSIEDQSVDSFSRWEMRIQFASSRVAQEKLKLIDHLTVDLGYYLDLGKKLFMLKGTVI